MSQPNLSDQLNRLSYATDAGQLARARGRYLAVGIVLPLVIGLGGVLLMLQWLPELPEPAAIHWSGAGAPDGFGPAWTFPLILGILAFAFPLVMGLIVYFSTRRGRWGGTVRFLGAFLPGFVAFLTVGLTWSVGVQRGLADARDAPNAGIGLLIGAGAGAVITAICWFLQPKVDVTPEGTAPAKSITLEAGTRAVWVRSVRTATGGIIAVALASVLLIASAIFAASTGSPVAWIISAVAVLITLLGLTMLAFTVTVDSSGLTVRGYIGWPTWRVPIADVAEVRVTDVNPLADFGGWGVRQAPGGRRGIVVRTGAAIDVRRRSGKTLVVTVDDADRGAALLQAFARKKR